MKTYHKIQSLYKRNIKGKMLFGEYSTPELEILKDIRWRFTEKIDGTNIRVIWDGEKVVFKGKTDNAQMYVGLYERLTELFPVDQFKKLEYPAMCLYGEGFGAKIQKGGGNYYSDRQDFILFDVFCGGLWLTRENVTDIAIKLGIMRVPLIGAGTLQQMEALVLSGMKSRWGDFTAEGIVARPEVELFDRRGNRIITKIKAKDFKVDKDGSESNP